MDRADKIDLILSVLRGERNDEDLIFTITGHLLQEDGTTQETGDIAVITWLFRGGRFAEQVHHQPARPAIAFDTDPPISAAVGNER